MQLVFYFDTGETGTARKNCTNHFPFSIEAFNYRNITRLKKAMAEAEQYIREEK